MWISLTNKNELQFTVDEGYKEIVMVHKTIIYELARKFL